MLVKDVLERIRFATATLNDLSGKNTNNLFSNNNIVQQLKYSLDKYAAVTQAIEGIYSFPLDPDTKYVPAPTNALRSETYRAIIVYIQQRIYCLNIPDLADALSLFPYEIAGVPRFVIPWEKMIYFYPTNSNSYNTTNLTENINESDITIPVYDTNSFPLKDGRVTIGEEKIHYQYTDGTNFYHCQRGVEDTVAANHIKGSVVKENNCHMFYYKRHFDIPVSNTGFITSYWLDREMEVCDEHIEVISDYTAYKLCMKIDPTRARAYEVNFDQWLKEARSYIFMGRNKMAPGGDIDNPYLWQTKNYLGYSM